MSQLQPSAWIDQSFVKQLLFYFFIDHLIDKERHFWNLHRHIVDWPSLCSPIKHFQIPAFCEMIQQRACVHVISDASTKTAVGVVDLICRFF